MYFTIILLFILFVPPVVITHGLKRRVSPYKVLYRAIVAVSAGVVLVLLEAQLTGVALGEQIIAEATKAAEIIASSDDLSAKVGLAKLSEAERVRVLVTLYGTANSLMPCTVIIATAIYSYISYLYISHVWRKAGKDPIALIPISDFKWPSKTFLGFSIMFILSWAAEFIDIFDGMNILANVNILFEFVLAFQGLAVIFYILKSVKAPRFLGILAAIAGIITGMGRIILFMIGIFDMFLNLRARADRR